MIDSVGGDEREVKKKIVRSMRKVIGCTTPVITLRGASQPHSLLPVFQENLSGVYCIRDTVRIYCVPAGLGQIFGYAIIAYLHFPATPPVLVFAHFTRVAHVTSQ